MSVLKQILKYLFGLIDLVMLVLLIILWVDSSRPSYLSIDHGDETCNQSYLIKNVNIVPMNQDTILTNKIVYIKYGVIARIGDMLRVY